MGGSELWLGKGGNTVTPSQQGTGLSPQRVEVLQGPLQQSGSMFVLGGAAAIAQAQLGTGWSSPIPGRSSLVHSRSSIRG